MVRMHLAIFFFMLLVFEVHQASWIHELVVFIKFRNFLAIISPNIFFSGSLSSFRCLIDTYI